MCCGRLRSRRDRNTLIHVPSITLTRVAAAARQLSEPASIELSWTRLVVVLASTRVTSRVNAARMASFAYHSVQRDKRAPRLFASAPMPGRGAEASTSHRRGAPSRALWRSPVSLTALHVFLCERVRFLRGRTHRPELKGPCLLVCLCAHAPVFAFPASLTSHCVRTLEDVPRSTPLVLTLIR